MENQKIKIWLIIPGRPKESWETVVEPFTVLQEGTANRMTSWWKNDQGREDTKCIEICVEVKEK